jgi:hypothetical protein
MASEQPKEGRGADPCRTMTIMGRRTVTATAVVPARGTSASPRGAPDDEAKVRTYLRLLIGAPARAADRLDRAETAFIDAAAGWSERSGVDRKTLADLGVPREILDAAGLRATPVAELVRRQYGKSPFTAADLVRKSGVSMASVRNVLAEDEQTGRVTRVRSEGRTILYGLR